MKLHFSNGGVYVYDADDWITIRKTHKLVGCLVGNTDVIPLLPAKLLIEEALLLQEKNLASIVEIINYNRNSEDVKEKYENFNEEVYQQQLPLFRQKRRTQLEGIIEKIVEQKRKNNGDERSQEVILEEELDKSCLLTRNNVIWPIFLTQLDANEAEYKTVDKDVLLSLTTALRWKVFKDLWEKGYHLTQGQKFGGDFLVYYGDPLVFHAAFIVHCFDDPLKPIKSRDFIAMGRLSNSVKKRAVLATHRIHGESDENITYFTISWDS